MAEGVDEDKIPVHIYLWQNGMVMAFNAKGQQIPEYQGPIEEAIKVIPEEYHSLIQGRQWPGSVLEG